MLGSSFLQISLSGDESVLGEDFTLGEACDATVGEIAPRAASAVEVGLVKALVGAEVTAGSSGFGNGAGSVVRVNAA